MPQRPLIKVTKTETKIHVHNTDTHTKRQERWQTRRTRRKDLAELEEHTAVRQRESLVYRYTGRTEKHRSL